MLKALGLLIKLTVFSIVILLAGEWLHWDGKSLAQHVQAQFARAERSDAAGYVRDLTRRVTSDARAGFEKRVHQHGSAMGLGAGHDKSPQPRKVASSVRDSSTENSDRLPMQAAAPASELRTVARTQEQLAPSERQKLRALIRELNSSQD
jgi:hypothetical protein